MRTAAFLTIAVLLASCNSQGDNVSSSDSAALSKGSPICGSSKIRGKRIARVRSSSSSACGFGDAVEVYSVSGVALNGSTKMTCNTAKALETWTRKSAVPATRRTAGEKLTGMTVWVSYACRNRSSGRLSEHAKGNALDIAGFTTNKGSFTVVNDWRKGAYGRVMQTMKKGACGPFGVVLHPDNDANHKDHFHFDTSNRSGRYSYCKQNP